MTEWPELEPAPPADDTDVDMVGQDSLGAVQLGLFTPERAETEQAFAALDSLEFERAEELFRGMLARDAGSPQAGDGLAAVGHWRRLHASLDGLAATERALALWHAIHECPPRLRTRTLCRRLLREVLELLETANELQSIPELCAGEVLLALGRVTAARAWLEWAVRRQPESARIQLLLGDALWSADSASAARACYSRGLLLDPTLPRWRSVAWRELARSVCDVGADATALEWWATARLPVPPCHVAGTPHPAVATVWRAIAEAEAARSAGQFDDILRSRSRLREQAPVMFELYMERLEGS